MKLEATDKRLAIRLGYVMAFDCFGHFKGAAKGRRHVWSFKNSFGTPMFCTADLAKGSPRYINHEEHEAFESALRRPPS